jgi:hypothetical protein
MANTHNQPSHEAQVKGGQHSHQQSESQSDKRTPPSKEEAAKGGQHSHSGKNQ